MPKGCSRLGYRPNTLIETKTRLTSGSLLMARQLLDRLRRSGSSVNEFLIYYINEDEKGIRDNKIIECLPAYEGVRVIDFYSLLSQYEELKLQQSKRDSAWKKRSEKNLERAIAVFSQGKNTLFIGAGVSCSAGLPNWDELLIRVGEALVAKGKISASQLLTLPKDAFNNDLVLARLLKSVNHEEGKDGFIKLIHDALYGLPFDRTSALLDSVVQLIKTNRIDSAISYNYDDLLEIALLEGPTPVPVSPIDKKNRPLAGTFPILHVHGFLPEHVDPSYERNIVLSEEEYHELYRDAFHWANIEQLHALTQSTCFFIGLSLKDPSIRRLLDIAHQRGTKDPEHYAFLCRPEFSSPKHTERLLHDMGVNVIWYTNKDHTDLPPMINKLI